MFLKSATQPVTIWGPSPDAQTAHDWLLARLQAMGLPFADGGLTTRVQGNLGECMFMLVNEANDYAEYQCFAANAYQPLQDISRSEMDIVWVWLDDNPHGDYVVLQEIKTTGADDLAYAGELLNDYSKLFGTDLAMTLGTRLNAVANALEFGQGHVGHADRVRTLGGLTPQATTGVVLLPSVVYDRAKVDDPTTKMAAVRQSVVSLGWQPDSVESTALGLEDLLARLERLKAGQS